MGAGRQDGGILRSTDRGQTFKFVNVGLPTVTYNLGEEQLSLAFDPTGTVAAVATDGGIYATTDQGDYWQDIGFNAIPKYFSSLIWQNGFLWTVTAGEGVLRSDRPLTVSGGAPNP